MMSIPTDPFDDHELVFNWEALAQRLTKKAWNTNHWETHGYLDVNDTHPALFGDAILLRDDDGMGFALHLGELYT